MRTRTEKTPREQALELLHDCGSYNDYNGNVESVMDELGCSRDEAEGHVDAWIHENDDMYRGGSK